MAYNERPAPNSSAPSTSTTGAFAYQTRLLESSSLSRTSSLSRSSSVTKSLLSPSGTRRWMPSHRPALSTDSSRAERARIEPDHFSRVGEHQSRSPLATSPMSSPGEQWSETHDNASRSFARTFPAPVTPTVQTLDSGSTTPSALPRRNTYSSPSKQPETFGNDRPLPGTPATSWDRPGHSSITNLPKHTSSAESTSHRPPLPTEYQRFDAPPTPTPVLAKHRSAPSVDSVRGRWEERVKEAEAAELTPQSTGSSQRRWTASSSSISRAPRFASPERVIPHKVPENSNHPKESTFPTPTYLKRQTLPNPVSPSIVRGQWEERSRSHDATGLDELGRASLEGNPSPEPRLRTRTTSVDSSSDRFSPISKRPILSTPTPTPAAALPSPVKTPDLQFSPFSSSSSTVPQYTSLKKNENYGALGSRRLGQHLPRIASGDGNEDLEEPTPRLPPNGESGKNRYNPKTLRTEVDQQWDRDRPSPLSTPQQSPTKADLFIPPVANASVVSGKPDRIRLSRQDIPPATPSPLPSARLTRGLWADTQRHLLIAYEYLCHIGEAQQWIEGCLNEELGFGVVEMEEGLRNGVVLARLARVWEGDAVVRRIFEVWDKLYFDLIRLIIRQFQHPKLQYRHSDNINHFLTFVRRAGLPEVRFHVSIICSALMFYPQGFIFELTDLYEKKNIPKVIYCIHALRSISFLGGENLRSHRVYQTLAIFSPVGAWRSALAIFLAGCSSQMINCSKPRRA